MASAQALSLRKRLGFTLLCTHDILTEVSSWKWLGWTPPSEQLWEDPVDFPLSLGPAFWGQWVPTSRSSRGRGGARTVGTASVTWNFQGMTLI